MNRKLKFFGVFIAAVIIGGVSFLGVRYAIEERFKDGVIAYHAGEYETAGAKLSLLAELGHKDSQFSLAVMHERGRGFNKSIDEASRWYLLSAEKGHQIAQLNLGKIYLRDKKYTEAVKWMTLSADSGYANAQYVLASLYEFGDGVPKDEKKAFQLFKLSAEQGNADAQYSLYFSYRHGMGTPVNESEEIKWLKTAAGNGHPDAQYILAISEAEKGNAEAALKLTTLAAEQGLSDAQLSLGEYYYHGVGVPQDYKKSAAWILKAASQGNAKAQFNLGALYSKGHGMPSDFIIAYALINLAASGDDEDVSKKAKVALSTFSTMPTSSIIEAQKLSGKMRNIGITTAIEQYHAR